MPTKQEVLNRYEMLHSWKAVALELGVNKAVAYRYANEPTWEPKRPDLRKKLGLPRLDLIRQRRGPNGTFIGPA